ncbi:MAG: hypothetical protein GEV07_05885 [Streptosporangiales bacterium]|nr:hypothetical protein [Streptosporangiales bacterium]
MNAIPVLRPGTHLHPSDGMCLTEWVSVLAGEPFTDEPLCMEPVLATLARLVNDDLDDATRQGLVDVAPRLVGATGDGPWSASDVVAAALGRMVPVSGLPNRRRRNLDRHLRRASRRSTRLRRRTGHAVARRVSTWLYRRGPANAALASAVHSARLLAVVHREALLSAMLHAGLGALVPPDRNGPVPASSRHVRH